MRKQAVLAAMLLVLVASVPAWARGGGGCLAGGTPIPTPAGAVAIENLRIGDPVWSVAEGKLQAGTVQALTEARADHYLEILAGDSRMVITPEHPVMAGPGEYRIARLLKVGDRVYRMQSRGASRGSHPLHSACPGRSTGVQSAGDARRDVHSGRHRRSQQGMLSSREPDSASRRHRKADQRRPAGGSIAGLFAGRADRSDQGEKYPSPYRG